MSTQRAAEGKIMRLRSRAKTAAQSNGLVKQVVLALALRGLSWN